jgi:hypothetical protein
MAVKRIKKSAGGERSAKSSERKRLGDHVAGTSSSVADSMNMEKSLLDEEVAYYLAQLAGWREHEGQHVLIRGQEHYGFFPTRDLALEEGFRRFGRVGFLVKEIRQNDEQRPLAWTIL